MEKKNVSVFNLKVPWGHVAAKAWGDKTNTGVLVVHGVLDNAGAYDRLIMQLPQNFYYVCIDLPGHGLSSHFPAGLTLNYFNYLLAIRYILDELKWEKTYYIGHSLGAHLGLLFSIIYSDRIIKLILIDGVIPKPISNDDIITRIRLEHDAAIEGYKIKNPRRYTKEEVLYALQNLRKCCLTSNAANATFERSVTKVGDDAYCYSRDFRARITIAPIFNIDQSLYLIRHLNVDTFIILVTDTLDFIRNIKPRVVNTLKSIKCVNIIEVNGNHDIHNNYPERISGHISKFLCQTPSKL